MSLSLAVANDQLKGQYSPVVLLAGCFVVIAKPEFAACGKLGWQRATSARCIPYGIFSNRSGALQNPIDLIAASLMHHP